MQEIIHIRGEGGVVFAMALPLPRHIEQRLEKGYLKRVNADGSPYVEQADNETGSQTGSQAGSQADNGSDLTNAVPARPPVNAPKADWVAYAVHALGVEPDQAEGATKQDLIDLAGSRD